MDDNRLEGWDGAITDETIIQGIKEILATRGYDLSCITLTRTMFQVEVIAQDITFPVGSSFGVDHGRKIEKNLFCYMISGEEIVGREIAGRWNHVGLTFFERCIIQNHMKTLAA